MSDCGCVRTEHKKSTAGLEAFNRVFKGYKSSAKDRGYEFQLTEEKAKILFADNCFYCGSSPSNTSKRKNGNGDFIYNGLDRVDNSLGYVENNVVTSCKVCNFAKRTQTLDEFKLWSARVFNTIHSGIVDYMSDPNSDW